MDKYKGIYGKFFDEIIKLRCQIVESYTCGEGWIYAEIANYNTERSHQR